MCLVSRTGRGRKQALSSQTSLRWGRSPHHLKTSCSVLRASSISSLLSLQSRHVSFLPISLKRIKRLKRLKRLKILKRTPLLSGRTVFRNVSSRHLSKYLSRVSTFGVVRSAFSARPSLSPQSTLLCSPIGTRQGVQSLRGTYG